MAKEKETVVVILQESVTKSLIKDLGTFILFAGLLLFNHQYLAGSTFVDFLFILIVILFLTARKSSGVYNGDVKGAKKFLEDK